MKPIVTLTLNPAIDSSCQAQEVHPVHKVRTFEERYDPGGGGINVARVIRELGGEAMAMYLAGGFTGEAFTHMLEAIGLQHRAVPIQGYTRVSHTVYERSTGKEYRFVPQGPEIREDEWRACLRELDGLTFDYFVASGSLPRGVPDDFYADLAYMVRERGARFVLDTSGEALARALDARVHLVKPNLRELESVFGRSLREPALQEEAAMELIESGRAEIVTVSLGADGALLATRAGCKRLRSPEVKPKSAVGAGDSFV
ncbi:MAG TPA: 1-phosphofructokinase family hexose kinase, partial [Geminicoccaceae bacterium]|nr:1-phosphofructokinase family hexose kinase [Geminicoccaceae bacterium]